MENLKLKNRQSTVFVEFYFECYYRFVLETKTVELLKEKKKRRLVALDGHAMLTNGTSPSD